MVEAETYKKGNGAAWLLLIVMLVALGFVAGQFIDQAGYISHVAETSITADGSWLVGETKECTSVPLNADGAAYLHKDLGDVLSLISCDDGPSHKVKAMFYGRKNQPDHLEVYWSCTRNSVSVFNDNAFTCKQTGAI